MSFNKELYKSAEEERRWNALSQLMSQYHNWFKVEYKRIYEMADGSFSKRGYSLHMYLGTVMQFKSGLTAHHTTEEHLVFPILAKKIPQFARHGDHLDSHRAIHDGLEDLVNHVAAWRKEPKTYSSTEMKECLDNLAKVLFKHLDQEVEDIKGDNLKPHFKLEEIEAIVRMGGR